MIPKKDFRANGIATIRRCSRTRSPTPAPSKPAPLKIEKNKSGCSEWVLADQMNPGPSALVAYLCSTDFYRMFYPGGAFSLESALFWALRSYKGVLPSPKALERAYTALFPWEADNRAVGEEIDFFNDWVKHTERDKYWAQIDGQDRVKHLKAPTLLMAGWYDPFLPTQLNDFIQIQLEASPEIASKSRLIIGPWAHAEAVVLPNDVTPRNFRLESLAPSIEWFDQHLSGIDVAHHAPVRIYVMGLNTWRDETEWPLARTRYTPYYLRSGGKANTAMGDGMLAPDVPTSQDSLDTYLYDPRHPVPTAGGAMIGYHAGIVRQNTVEARSDVLVYTTNPLEEDLEVTGPIRLILYVATDVTCTDFTGKLVDVHPDSSAYNVSDGILRRCYSKPNRVSKRIQPVQIQIDVWPTSIVFLKGHRIRLEVSSSNYPRFDRNLNTGKTDSVEVDPVIAKQMILHGKEAPSHLMLPVVQK